MSEIPLKHVIAPVTPTDDLARMLTHKGLLARGERELIFRNAIGFLRASPEAEVRRAADRLERSWEQGRERAPGSAPPV